MSIGFEKVFRVWKSRDVFGREREMEGGEEIEATTEIAPLVVDQ